MANIEDFVFKKRTDVKPVEAFLKKTMNEFAVLVSSSTASTYKIYNLFLDRGVKHQYIELIDGQRIESYFSYTAKRQFNQIQIDTLLTKGLLSTINGKWLFITNMSYQWRPEIVYFFCDKLKYAGCQGFILDSTGENNFGQILIEQTDLSNELTILQFPEKKYAKHKLNVEDDGY